MNRIDIQPACPDAWRPAPRQLRQWVDAALRHRPGGAQITVRIVGEAESAALNHQYRGQPKPTNILSFPYQPPPLPGLRGRLLGDLVVCAPVLEREARAQQKPLADHWAHIIVHGVLHLAGHDHQHEAEAEAMERLEADILSALHIANPYLPAAGHD